MINSSKQTFVRTCIVASFLRMVSLLLMLTSLVLVPAAHQIADPHREQSTSSLGAAARYLERGSFECVAQDKRTGSLDADCHKLGEHAHDTPRLVPYDPSGTLRPV